MLSAGGQTIWQIMPLSPPGPGNSPYAARSTFAFDPMLISPDELAAEGLIESSRLANPPSFSDGRVHFYEVRAWKERLLEEAFERFRQQAPPPEYEEFLCHAEGWLEDYALFIALRRRHGERSWRNWPAPLRQRETEALRQAETELADEIACQRFVQWLAYRQWQAVRQEAHAADIRIVGDVPIFVDYDSADVWANQGMFKLDSLSEPEMVAGVPPDYFSKTGQRWGNPLYRWDVLREGEYAWWVARMRWTLELVDMVRLDHFRAFEAAWEIPAHEPTAVNGSWVTGPGRELFDVLERELGPTPIIVEDLGLITPEVRALRDELGYPGMKLLQFAFDSDACNPYLPHNIPPNSVVYTGTHDNDTTTGWLADLPDEVREKLRRYLGHECMGADDLIRMAYGSVAETTVIPMQDVLLLGSEARTNVPGHPDGNWAWRFRWAELDEGRTGQLREMVEMYGRDPHAACWADT